MVFTQLMTDDELVDAALALCQMRDQLGSEAAVAEASATARSLDWNAPANASMLERMLETASLSVCAEAGGTAPLESLSLTLPARPQIDIGANPSEVDESVAAFLESPDGAGFIATIREQEASQGPVFTESMSDEDLVHLGRGICSTQAELGPSADDELRRHQAAYGWTSDADTAAFNLLIASVDAVCATVGA